MHADCVVLLRKPHHVEEKTMSSAIEMSIEIERCDKGKTGEKTSEQRAKNLNTFLKILMWFIRAIESQLIFSDISSIGSGRYRQKMLFRWVFVLNVCATSFSINWILKALRLYLFPFAWYNSCDRRVRTRGRLFFVFPFTRCLLVLWFAHNVYVCSKCFFNVTRTCCGWFFCHCIYI